MTIKDYDESDDDSLNEISYEEIIESFKELARI
jgi:hypothetical protein